MTHPNQRFTLAEFTAQRAGDLMLERERRMTQSDSDDIPTMGDEVESILRRFTCMCGQPKTPGVMHRYDKPCYVIEDPMDNATPNPQTGSQGLEDMIPAANTDLDRLKADHWDLDKRGMALSKFIRGEVEVAKGKGYKDLSPRDQFLLGQQMTVMSSLFAILSERVYRAENPAWAKQQDADMETNRGVGEGGTDGTGT